MPFVYFIHERDNFGCFKIGKTENHPADRMEQLQTGNPRKLYIYRWLQIDDCSTMEEFLHMLFQEMHIRGEWFNVTTHQIDEQCEAIAFNNKEAMVSGKWEPYTDEDRLNVKEQRQQKGKYKGKLNPKVALERKNKFMEKKQLEKAINIIGYSDK